MNYSEKLLDHFNHPRNMGSLDKDDPHVGTGVVGSPECGDVMKLQIRVDEGTITDARFKTFGCGAAIASSSLATEWLKGRTLQQAEGLQNTQLADELALPPVKVHCSVLAEGAVKAAIEDWKQKHGLAGEAPAELGVSSCEVCPTRETCGPVRAVEGENGRGELKPLPAAAPQEKPDPRLIGLRAEAGRILKQLDEARPDGGGGLGEHERRMLDMAVAMLRASLDRDDPDQILLAIDMVNEASEPLAETRRSEGRPGADRR